jgi:hypothetical protein
MNTENKRPPFLSADEQEAYDMPSDICVPFVLRAEILTSVQFERYTMKAATSTGGFDR